MTRHTLCLPSPVIKEATSQLHKPFFTLASSGILDFDLYSMFLSYIPFYLKASDLVICYSSLNLLETLIKEFAHVEGTRPYFNPFQHSLYWKSVYSVFLVSLLCFKLVNARSTENIEHQIKALQKRTDSLEELCNCYLLCRHHWSHNTNIC